MSKKIVKKSDTRKNKMKKEKTSKIKRKIITFLIVVFFIALAILIQRLIFHKINSENEAKMATLNETKKENTVTDENVVNNENQTEENKNETNEEIGVVPTMQDELLSDATWCGTLQLVWNDLMKEAGGELIFDPSITMAENLNKKEFTSDDISEDDYYQTYGLQTKKLKETIEKEIEEKFDEKSDILDSFEWFETEKEAGNNYFFYAILKKVFTFEYEFEDLEKGTFEDGKYENIEYFGTSSDTDDRVKRQIRILYYNNDEDFAVSISTKENENIILCNNPEGKNFKEIYDNINTKNKQYSGIRILEDKDDFKMPNIKIDLEESYDDLVGKEFKTEKSEGRISQVLQTIQLELNKKGGTLKSEAGISADITSAIITDEKTPKHLYLDDSFVMFLVENDKDTPYYAAKITDITKFQ